MVANATTAKLSVLVTPATKRKLESEARARKVTVGELVRQRLSGEPDGDEQAFLEALVDLGKRAESVIAKLDAANQAEQDERRRWPAREADIRKQTRAALTKADRAALARLLAPTPAGAAR